MSTDHPLNYVPDSFWEAIALAQANQEQFIETLKGMSRDDLLNFIWTFEGVAAEFKYEPYTDYVSQELSEDGIDDVAMWVVEQGRDYTYTVFDTPSQMPKRVDHPIGFLSKAVRTFYQRFGGPVPLKP
jgi:hypothetical protein